VAAPTFTECVIGYRRWVLVEDQLWPVSCRRRPWLPGINEARCWSGAPNPRAAVWTIRDGRRRLEPAPLHDAPAAQCPCGLYSLRRPSARWALAASTDDRVTGAVASWGNLRVHPHGYRAQYACVVALALPDDASPELAARLERAALRYRVALVARDELEEEACRHGSPLAEPFMPSLS
jgi:hypothetical protein